MRKLAVFLLATVFAACFCMNVSAVDGAIDLNRTGTLSVTMECSHGYRSGGIVALYPVAFTVWENNSYNFEYTEDFRDCGMLLDNISDDMEANRFAAYAEENGITPQRVSLKSGVAVFEDLPVGLYMVVHEETSSDFTMAWPFFVTIPMSSGDVWDYTVDATPKVEVEHSELEHPPGIPITGQLKWPVPVMAFSGIVIFTVGWVLFRRNKIR